MAESFGGNMKQEDKELLIKDLCARLPYEVKFKHSEGFDTFEGIVDDLINPTNEHWYNIEDIKPYLFPLSSMTEEQYKEFNNLTDSLRIDGVSGHYRDYCGPTICNKTLIDSFAHEYNTITYLKDYLICINWLNEHHFDFRNLIERGLAIDCTNLNIY